MVAMTNSSLLGKWCQCSARDVAILNTCDGGVGMKFVEAKMVASINLWRASAIGAGVPRPPTAFRSFWLSQVFANAPMP